MYPDRILQQATATSRQPGKERADTGTTSVSSGAGEKSKVSVPVSPWCSVLSAERPKSSKTDLASLVCLAASKRTSPALQTSSVSVPFSPWCSVFSAERPKSSKTDLASLVCLAVLLALPLVVRFGRSAAQILPKRTSPCWSAWLCSLLSRWWSVLAAQQPKSSKMDLLSALDLLSCVCSPAGVPF